MAGAPQDEEVFRARLLVRALIGCLLVPTVALGVACAWGFAAKGEPDVAWGSGAVFGVVALCLLVGLLRSSGALILTGEGVEERTPISCMRLAWSEIGDIRYSEGVQHAGYGSAVEWKCVIRDREGRLRMTLKSTYERSAFAALIARAGQLGFSRSEKDLGLGVEILLTRAPAATSGG